MPYSKIMNNEIIIEGKLQVPTQQLKYVLNDGLSNLQEGIIEKDQNGQFKTKIILTEKPSNQYLFLFLNIDDDHYAIVKLLYDDHF